MCKYVACLCVWMVASSSSPASDWSQWRGPHRDGVAVDSPDLIEELPADGLKPKWVTTAIPSAGNGGWSSPVVAEGNVYVYAHVRTQKPGGEIPKRQFPWLPPEKRGNMTEEQFQEYERKRRDEDFQIAIGGYEFHEELFCFDLETGQTKWTAKVDSVYTRFLHSGTPIIHDGLILVLGAGRVARGFDAQTGAQRWQTPLPGEFRDEFMMSSFVVADGVGVVLCGHLFGLDVPTGELLWQGDPMRTQGTHSSPAVWSNGGKSYVLCNVAGKDTICVAPKTGEELWRVQSQAGLSTPLVVGDRMITYGRSRKDGVRCFELSVDVAKELWANNGLADKGSSPVVVDGRVYVQGERRLACIDLETGKTNWRTLLDLDQPEYTSPIAADEKVFYVHDGVLCFEARADRYAPLFEAKMDEDGLLAGETQHREKLGIPELEKSEGGREKAADLYRRKVSRHGPLRCTSPAIAQGKLIVRRPNGLVCYDLSAPSVASRKDQD